MPGKFSPPEVEQKTLPFVTMSNLHLNTHVLVVFGIYVSPYYIMLNSPSQSMGFHVLGRQPDELQAFLETSNSVHYDLL